MDDGDYPCWFCSAEFPEHECETCGLAVCSGCAHWIDDGCYCGGCAEDVIANWTIDSDQKERKG